MNNNLLQIKVKQRLNKLASQDYDNLECWQITEAFNNASLKWVRTQILGLNIYQTGDEGSKNLIDDLQHLVKNQDLTFTGYIDNVETQVLPSDYLYFKRITLYVKSATCNNPKMMVAYLAQEADVSVLLNDHLTEPNFEWGETFFTISNNRIKVYTKGKFIVTKVVLSYYKKPRKIAILGCRDIATNTVIAQDVQTDFKEDIAEIIVDLTVNILAGDLESFNQFQISQEKVKTIT